MIELLVFFGAGAVMGVLAYWVAYTVETRRLRRESERTETLLGVGTPDHLIRAAEDEYNSRHRAGGRD